jgi:hypothetical protein
VVLGQERVDVLAAPKYPSALPAVIYRLSSDMVPSHVSAPHTRATDSSLRALLADRRGDTCPVGPVSSPKVATTTGRCPR